MKEQRPSHKRLQLTSNSSLESSKFKASRLPWMWETPVALGMTLVPFWMAHLISTCAIKHTIQNALAHNIIQRSIVNQPDPKERPIRMV